MAQRNWHTSNIMVGKITPLDSGTLLASCRWMDGRIWHDLRNSPEVVGDLLQARHVAIVQDGTHVGIRTAFSGLLGRDRTKSAEVDGPNQRSQGGNDDHEEVAVEGEGRLHITAPPGVLGEFTKAVTKDLKRSGSHIEDRVHYEHSNDLIEVMVRNLDSIETEGDELREGGGWYHSVEGFYNSAMEVGVKMDEIPKRDKKEGDGNAA